MYDSTPDEQNDKNNRPKTEKRRLGVCEKERGKMGVRGERDCSNYARDGIGIVFV